MEVLVRTAAHWAANCNSAYQLTGRDRGVLDRARPRDRWRRYDLNGFSENAPRPTIDEKERARPQRRSRWEKYRKERERVGVHRMSLVVRAAAAALTLNS